MEHHVDDYICASSHDALTVVGVVNKLDRRRVLLPARRYASAGTSHGSVSVSVCLSVTSRCSVETVERIELVLDMIAYFYFSYTVLKRNLRIFKNKGTSPWHFVPNSGLISPRHIDRRPCYQLSLRKVDAQSVIYWTVVGQLSWQCLRPLAGDRAYHSNRKASLQHDSVARFH